MEMPAWFRLSWRITVVFLGLYLFIAKRDTLKKLGTSDKLWLRWCFNFMLNWSGDKELLILWKVPREIRLGILEVRIYESQAREYLSFLYSSPSQSSKSYGCAILKSSIHVSSHYFFLGLMEALKAFLAVLYFPSNFSYTCTEYVVFL